MEKRQEEKNLVINGAIDYLDLSGNTTLINSFPTMKNDVVHFKANVAGMNVQIGISQGDIRGITVNQQNARGSMATLLADTIYAPATRYARGIGDADLLLLFKHSESQIGHYALSGVVPYVTRGIDKAEELIGSTPAFVTSTEMTAGIITAARAAVEAFSGFLGQAKLMNRDIRRALHKIDAIQKEIWEFDFENLLDDAHHFSADHPEFAEGLAMILKIDDLPTSHTGINGFGHDVDGNVIEGGAIYITGLPERAPMSFDILGYYHDDTFKWGTYHIKFTHPDFVEKIVTVTIPRGRKVVVNVVMERRP